MNTIKTNLSSKIIVNKSKFIGKIYKVCNIDEVENILNDIRSKYSDASHICYAYIIDNKIKYSDDKEPTGTAGGAILNLLKTKNLNYVCAVVIRYFGGIKLGTGGLSRAYTGCINEAIDEIIPIIKGFDITISFTYDESKYIKNILKKVKVNKMYNKDIQYQFKISCIDYKNIENSLKKHAIIISKKSILL